MSGRILVFGGTSEGVALARALPELGCDVTVCVATDYGALMLKDCPVRILTGRLDAAQMAELMRDCSCVIDATHPYAVQVTANIKAAAEQTGVPYYRLLRPEGSGPEKQWLTASTPEEAAQVLQARPGNVLLTTGSKDLAAFTALPDYQERVWVRILASEASLHQALSLGYPPNHIIAMHGPFSKELNAALLRQFHIHTLVTKRSGRAGGFWEKAEAAEETGAALLVIDRPVQEQGMSLPEIVQQVRASLSNL